MSYDRLNTTPEAVAEAIIKVAETDLELAIELLKEVKKTESPEIMNATQQPLICLSVTPTTPPAIGVWVNTENKNNGSWRTVAYVNGNFYACSEGKDRKDNIDYIRKALAEGGHKMPVSAKELAPVMSAKMPKKSNAKAA